MLKHYWFSAYLPSLLFSSVLHQLSLLPSKRENQTRNQISFVLQFFASFLLSALGYHLANGSLPSHLLRFCYSLLFNACIESHIQCGVLLQLDSLALPSPMYQSLAILFIADVYHANYSTQSDIQAFTVLFALICTIELPAMCGALDKVTDSFTVPRLER